MTTAMAFPDEAINTPNNGGQGDPEPLLLVEEGAYFGHANPVRSNQNMAMDRLQRQRHIRIDRWRSTRLADISALVPAELLDSGQMQSGFLIDPTKFAVGPGQTLADLVRRAGGSAARERHPAGPQRDRFAQDRIGRLVDQWHCRL